MNRKFSSLMILATVVGGAFLLSACQKEDVPKPSVCTADAKVCPDGSAVGRTGPDCAFAPCPATETPAPVEPKPVPPIEKPKPTPVTPGKTVSFGTAIVMRVNDTVVFSDGLVLTLKEINDSRCKPDVQCIWQGELSPLLIAKMADSSDEVRLGTERQTSLTLKGHTYSLKDVTEKTATVQVTL